MQSKIRIKTAKRKNDAERISILANEIWKEYFTPIIGKDQVKYMLDKFQSPKRIYEDITIEGYTYYVVYYSKKLIGYFAVRADKDDEGVFISKFYLKKDFRGNGVGRLMMNEVLEYAKEIGKKSICLNVFKDNTDAINIYKKMGFVIAGKIKTDIGQGFFMDDVKMELKGKKYTG